MGLIKNGDKLRAIDMLTVEAEGVNIEVTIPAGTEVLVETALPNAGKNVENGHVIDFFLTHYNGYELLLCADDFLQTNS